MSNNNAISGDETRTSSHINVGHSTLGYPHPSWALLLPSRIVFHLRYKQFRDAFGARYMPHGTCREHFVTGAGLGSSVMSTRDLKQPESSHLNWAYKVSTLAMSEPH